jgi:hypothetical protein
MRTFTWRTEFAEIETFPRTESYMCDSGEIIHKAWKSDKREQVRKSTTI